MREKSLTYVNLYIGGLNLCLLYYPMDLNTLSAISPIDGRYRNQVKAIAPYFSEMGLFRYRIRIEVEYFISLCELPLPQLQDFDKGKFEDLRQLYIQFNEENVQKIKEIEKTTNHDVKAVEYYIKEAFTTMDLDKYSEFIHFGLTSQDINNTAIPLSIKEFLEDELLPLLQEVQELIEHYAKLWETIPMLARTHGQAASPTLVGKEFRVFTARVKNQLNLLDTIPFSGKFGGATGNMNAHYATFPDIQWHDFANRFLESLGLTRSYPTTQIDHYDNLAALFDNIKRINTIYFDLCRDIWIYVSMDYFKQTIKDGEIGSSAMPHKVNPIDFENAEGNLGIANAIFEHLSIKLPVSRLQRDLTDSTVLRNLGVPFAHSFIAYRSIIKGLGKLELNKDQIDADLENNWVVIAEAIQNILRREGYPKPYEKLKDLTRNNKKVNQEEIRNFISELDIKEEIKEELLKITPHNYRGES